MQGQIEYRTYHLASANHLVELTLSPALVPEVSRDFTVTPGGLALTGGAYYVRQDTYRIEAPSDEHFLNAVRDTTSSSYLLAGNRFSRRQTTVRDTLWEGLSAKLLLARLQTPATSKAGWCSGITRVRRKSR